MATSGSPSSLGQLRQTRQATGVALDQVVLQLDERVVAAEQLGQRSGRLLCFVELLAVDQLRQLARGGSR